MNRLTGKNRRMKVNKSNTGQPKILPPTLPNLGVCHHYRHALQEMIVDMHISFEYWVTASYRKNPPRLAALIAQDSTPSDVTKKVITSHLGIRISTIIRIMSVSAYGGRLITLILFYITTKSIIMEIGRILVRTEIIMEWS